MNIKKIFASIVGLGRALRIQDAISVSKINEIIVDISASCNAKCPFCPRVFMPEDRAAGFMSVELFKFTLKEAKKHKINNLRLYSTAEPLLHPKFDELIDIAKGEGFVVSVSTNASLLHKHFEALLKVDLLQLSIEGWDKESYERYRYPLNFERIYENIKEFNAFVANKTNRPKITTNLLLTKKTDLKKYVELWGEFVDSLNLHFMYNPVKYENERFVSIDIDKDNEYYRLEPVASNFYCSYPFYILTVAYDGKIALCCDDFAADMPLGHISDGINAYLSSKKLKSVKGQFFSQKLDICKECSRFLIPTEDDVQIIRDNINNIDSQLVSKIVFRY